MKGTMRALVKYAKGYGNMRVEERPIPQCGADDVLMKVWGSCICGTDIHIFRDEYKRYVPGLVLGHEFSAIAVEVGKNVIHIREGDRVVSDVQAPNGTMGNDRVDGSHSEYLVMPGCAVHVLPEKVSMASGTLVEVFVACQHGLLETIKVRPGDFVAIIGPGEVGITMLQTAKLYTPRATLITGTRKDDIRLNMARKFNPTYLMYNDEGVVEKVMEATNGKGADVVIECSGSDEGINQALQMVKVGGWIDNFAVYDNHMVQADLSQITWKCINVVGSWGWIGFPEESTRVSGGAISYRRSLDILSNSNIDLESLITHKYALEDFEEAFTTLEEKKGVAVMFDPNITK